MFWNPRPGAFVAVAFFFASSLIASAQSTTVPTDVEMPGTQPSEASALDSPGVCTQCHEGVDALTEPYRPWQGSMMSHAARDPLYWATVAVSEQAFPGSGDACLRCHTPAGWLDGRSTPTDGSALNSDDAEGVTCTSCHMMVNTDGTEHPGIQNAPYVANDGAAPPEGYYGSSELVVTAGFDRMGPYAGVQSPHGTQQSIWMRSPEMCGTCHDVSNPVTGDLAPSNGHMVPLPVGTFSGVLGTPVDGKAAFNHPPYAFGTVERTYSEYKASLYETIRVNQYPSLPADLKAGVLEDVYLAAKAGVPSADFEDGTPRFYTCQSCHMQPAIGKGAKQPYAPVRKDIGRHDLTGGSIWVHEATKWLDDQSKLVMGGGLSTETRTAMDVGADRARALLRSAATVSVAGNNVRVTNLTGHKLISGYPEGRRMWLHVRWLGPAGELVREDGAFVPLQVTHKGQPLVVQSLEDPNDPNLRNYHVTMGIRQDWAATLLSVGLSPNLALEYDRYDGSVLHTLGQLAAQPAGTVWESAHFILNDQVLHDTRIPPYGMDYDEALKRSILPVPATQFGDPGPGGTFAHFDESGLDPPVGAATAELELLYQSASWEYVQFLDLAGDGSVAFLASTGADLVAAWLATGQSTPEWMAGTTWAANPGDCDHDGLQDVAEIAAGTEPDCNGNGVLDSCELAVDPAADLDFDGGLDVCQWLSADLAAVSLATGGTQSLALHAGSARAGDFYLTLGSASGVSPGIPVGAFSLPLGVDSYFLFTLTHANSPVLQSSFGSLDGNGAGVTTIAVPSGLSPALAGVVGWHAFVSLDGTSLAPTGVSNPVSVTLEP